MRVPIAAELLKLRTTRMLTVCVGVAVLWAAALPILTGAVAGHRASHRLNPRAWPAFCARPPSSPVLGCC